MTHELSTTDRFGEFCNWFRMRLSKIKELTDIFINREYIKPARSLMFQAEFRKRLELFIMNALYRLGTGSSFRTCCALCKISTSKVCLFFDAFLHVMHEMREEFIFMPTNINNGVAQGFQILRGSWVTRLLWINGCISCEVVFLSNW